MHSLFLRSMHGPGVLLEVPRVKRCEVEGNSRPELPNITIIPVPFQSHDYTKRKDVSTDQSYTFCDAPQASQAVQQSDKLPSNGTSFFFFEFRYA